MRIKRYSALIIAAVILVSMFSMGSFADISFTQTVTQEQDLTFTVSSDAAKTSTDIPIPAGYSNVKVLSSSVDNGNILTTTVSSNAITVNLDKGSYSNTPVTKQVTSTETLPIEKQMPTSGNTIVIDVNKNITAIEAVNSTDGGLLSADREGTTSLSLTVDPTKGVPGFDYTHTISKTVEISAPDTNRNKVTQSDTVEVIPFQSASITTNNGNTCSLYAHNDTSTNPSKGLISITFSNGTPTKTIKTVTSWSGPKRWVDRHSDLTVDTPNPNGSGSMQVKVNPNNFPGFTASTFDEPSTYPIPNFSEGVDFWGYYLGTKPELNKPLNTNASNLFLYGRDNYKQFTASQINSYKSDDAYSTIMATFVMSSCGISANRHIQFIKPSEEKQAVLGKEDQSTFYDPLYQAVKTKVFHWYYWAGPITWGTFGGITTYPYKATVTYQQYNPVKLYTGSVSYQYLDTVTIPQGQYNYSGKVHIQYTTTITGVDKNPGMPAGVIATKDSIMHGVSADDYTPPETMRYKYYYYKNSTWNYLGMNSNGIRTYSWDPVSLGLDVLNLRVGVVGVDNRNQESPRGENDPTAQLNITGSLDKTTVAPGDTLTITAETDSSPEAFQVDYNVESKYGSGQLTRTGKKPYDTSISIVSGQYKNDGYGTVLGDSQYSFNYTINQNGITNMTNASNFSFTFGNEGTIIIPDLNDCQYEDYQKFSDIAAIPNNTLMHDFKPYYFLSTDYTGSQTKYLSLSSGRYSFQTIAYYNYARNIDSTSFWSSYADVPTWYMNGGYMKGVTALIQIWDKRVYLPYWNRPVAVTFKGNVYKVFQNGVFVGQVTANSTMEGFTPAYYGRFISTNTTNSSNRAGSPGYSLGFMSGKHLFSNKIWSIDQINNYLNNAYPDNYHIFTDKFRVRLAEVPDTRNGGTKTVVNTDYGGVRYNGAPHPANLLDYIPGKLTWSKTITIPTDISGGMHNITLTAKNGLTKSINLSFFVNVPEVLTPKGIMPHTAVHGKTYTVTATSTQQANQMDLKVFGATYPMSYSGIVYQDKDYTVGSNLFPQPASNAEFTVKGNGLINPVAGQSGTYVYDYSQKLTNTWHGFDVSVDTSKYYTYSFDACISSNANISGSGTTFIADGENGFKTNFYYDNTKKGIWQHFETTAKPTTTIARLLLYPSASTIPAAVGNIQYKNIEFKVHPGAKKWNYNLQIPFSAQVGDYNTLAEPFREAEFKATSLSGKTESDYQPFTVVEGPKIFGTDYTAQPGETISIIATTVGYCSSANVVMPTGTVNLTSDNPASYYNNTWRGNYTVPIAQPLGNYDITYNASNAFATDSVGAKLNVVLSLAPIGDIPDSIETKTPWKARCTTTVSANSVTVSISPSPGAALYDMYIVSNDGSRKYWETDNLTYPEMASGGPDGKTITGVFTAAAQNGYSETSIDTGHLWEKIELTAFELRRLLYANNDLNQPVVETLSRTTSTEMANSAGFICAGWDLGIKLLTSGYVDKIAFDFDGPIVDSEKDNSIKTLDKLTKRFELDDVKQRNRSLKFNSLSDLNNNYIFPQSFSNNFSPKTDYHNIYTTYYSIPYGTKQSLHSWYTLRQESGTAFDINEEQLLSRIKPPFILKIRLYSKNRFSEKEIPFDVFERWDTLLNRDIRPFINNPGSHDPVSKFSWENSDYME